MTMANRALTFTLSTSLFLATASCADTTTEKPPLLMGTEQPASPVNPAPYVPRPEAGSEVQPTPMEPSPMEARDGAATDATPPVEAGPGGDTVRAESSPEAGSIDAAADTAGATDVPADSASAVDAAADSASTVDAAADSASTDTGATD